MCVDFVLRKLFIFLKQCKTFVTQGIGDPKHSVIRNICSVIIIYDFVKYVEKKIIYFLSSMKDEIRIKRCEKL